MTLIATSRPSSRSRAIDDRGRAAAELAIARAIHDSSSPAAKLSEYLVFALEIGCRDVRFGVTKHRQTQDPGVEEPLPARPDGCAGLRTLPRVKDEGDLAHLDSIALGQNDRGSGAFGCQSTSVH